VKPVKRTGNRLSDRALRDRMQQITGMDRVWAKLACRATVRAIEALLLEGRSVNLWRFGSFRFRFRVGRTQNMSLPSGAGQPRVRRVVTHADKVVVKFKPAASLSRKLRNLKPDQVEHLEMPKKSPIHYTPKTP